MGGITRRRENICYYPGAITQTYQGSEFDRVVISGVMKLNPNNSKIAVRRIEEELFLNRELTKNENPKIGKM